MTDQQPGPPLFIVGLPRTGSKLLMNMINLNSKAGYYVANEVQFFGHSFLGRLLQGRRGVMPIVESARDSQGNVIWEAVVDRLYSKELSGVHWSGLAAGWIPIPKRKLLKTLAESDGSAKDIYKRILTTQEKEFRAYGDKSGPNLYFLDKILEWFPHGKVIHIIRDPRAILTSQHKRLLAKLEHGSNRSGAMTAIKRRMLSPVIVLYIMTYWGYAMRIDKRFSQSHPTNYMRVQFEELVRNPEETTQRLCNFLRIPWDPNMTRPPKSDSSFIDPSDVMKVRPDRGVGMDEAAMQRWRQHIKPWMKLCCHLYGAIAYRGELKRFGYLE